MEDDHHRFVFRIPDRLEELEDVENFTNFYTVNGRLINNPAELTSRISECEQFNKRYGTDFILEKFDYFYFTIKYFKDIDQETCQKSWQILFRSLPTLYKQLDQFLNENYDLNNRRSYQNKLQMIVYAFIMLSELYEKNECNNEAEIEGQTVQNRKKKKNASNLSMKLYQDSKQHSISSLLQLLSLRLDRIFETAHFLTNFINIIMKWIYLIIENSMAYRLRSSIYFNNLCELISLTLDRYEHGVNFCMKIIEILQNKETSSSILSDIVAYNVRRLSHSFIINDIIDQIQSMDINILSKDNSAPRAISTFLIELGQKCTDIMFKHLSELFDFLEQDSYLLRNATLEIIATIILKKFRSPLLFRDVHIKNKLLEKLEEHIHDVTSYTRSRVLQLWCQLAENNAIPIQQLSNVVDLIIGRLNDKSCFVRKNAIHFLTIILKENTSNIMNKKDMIKIMEHIQKSKDEVVESLKILFEQQEKQQIDNSYNDDNNEQTTNNNNSIKRKCEEYVELLLKKPRKDLSKIEKLANDWERIEKSLIEYWQNNSKKLKEKMKSTAIPDDLPQDNLKNGMEYFRKLLIDQQFDDALIALSSLKSLYPNESLLQLKIPHSHNDDDEDDENNNDNNTDDDDSDNNDENENDKIREDDYIFLSAITNFKHNPKIKLPYELLLAKQVYLAPAIDFGNLNYDEETGSQKQMIENLCNNVISLENNDDNQLNDMRTITPESFENLRKKLEKLTMLYDRLKCAINIMNAISESMPTICILLNSRNITDVQESVQFCTQAYRMEIDNSLMGVQKMLKLIFNREKSIHDTLIEAFTEIFLNHSPLIENNKQNSNDLKTIYFMELKHLSDMILKLNQGELICAEAILNELFASKKFNQIHLQILWERYAKKYSKITDDDSRAALIIIGMLASAQPSIIRNESNLNNIITISLQPPHSNDHRFVADTCDVLLKSFKLPQIETMEKFFKLPPDHLLFARLRSIMSESIVNVNSNYWLRMSSSIIKVIYFLADKPDSIIAMMVKNCYEEIMLKSKFDESNNTEEIIDENETELLSKILNTTQNHMIVGQVNDIMIARFISILGDIAINLLIHLDLHLKKELKIRQFIREKQKTSQQPHVRNRISVDTNDYLDDTNDDNEMDDDLMTNNNDDRYQEQIFKICSESVLFDNGILKKFAPLIERIATDYDGNCYSICLRRASCLTLSKFMALSLKYTRKNRAILADILEKSNDSEIRSNAIISFGDLLVRFPNELEHFTKKIFSCLNDDNFNVKNNALIVLTRLILADMIKATGHISKIAQLIIDDNVSISSSARLFFVELGKKNNVYIYNYLPDIISNLSGQNGIDENKFHEMIKFLFELLEKTRNTESLVTKLCRRFSETTDERTWRDLSYCLSQLQYNDRAMDKLMDNFSFYAQTLYCNEIYDNFLAILNNIRKNGTIKTQSKIRLDEMEAKMKEIRSKSKTNDQQQQQSEEVDGIEQQNEPNTLAKDTNIVNIQQKCTLQQSNAQNTDCKKRTRNNRKMNNKQMMESKENDENIGRQLRKSKRINRRVIIQSDSEDDDDDADKNDDNISNEYEFDE